LPHEHDNFRPAEEIGGWMLDDGNGYCGGTCRGNASGGNETRCRHHHCGSNRGSAGRCNGTDCGGGSGSARSHDQTGYCNDRGASCNHTSRDLQIRCRYDHPTSNALGRSQPRRHGARCSGAGLGSKICRSDDRCGTNNSAAGTSARSCAQSRCRSSDHGTDDGACSSRASCRNQPCGGNQAHRDSSRFAKFTRGRRKIQTYGHSLWLRGLPQRRCCARQAAGPHRHQRAL
jgi:hypothetical protein